MVFLNVSPTARPRGDTTNSAADQEATGVLALPQAVAFSGKQLGGIEQARTVLLCVTRLAQKPPLESDPGSSENEYRSLAMQLQHLAASELNQVRLFDGATLSVDLSPDGNRLVMAGVNLNAAPYREALAASMDKPARVARALRKIAAALRQLAVDESIVSANVERLHLCLIETGMHRGTKPLPAVVHPAAADQAGEETLWHMFKSSVGEPAPTLLRAATG